MADLEKGVNPDSFTFQAPTKNVDDSNITAGLNINLYRAPDEASLVRDVQFLFYVVVADMNPGDTMVAPINQFPEGRHVCALTAVDKDGDESQFSQTFGFEIRVGPNPPTILA